MLDKDLSNDPKQTNKNILRESIINYLLRSLQTSVTSTDSAKMGLQI